MLGSTQDLQRKLTGSVERGVITSDAGGSDAGGADDGGSEARQFKADMDLISSNTQHYAAATWLEQQQWHQVPF